MNIAERTERSSILTSRMSEFLRDTFCLNGGVPILGGLPTGSAYYEEAQLIVSPSVCSINLFEHPMKAVANARGCDVLLARHGLHPEILDDVHFDAVIRTSSGQMLLTDLRLYLDVWNEAWQLPDRMGPYLAIDAKGVTLSFEAPYRTGFERADGVCKAAKRLALAARGAAHG